MCLMLVILGTQHVFGQGKLELYQGNQAYKNGNYDEALNNYEKARSLSPDNAIIAYNQGNASYRKEDYGAAINHFKQALDDAENEEFKARTLHNIGNCHMQTQQYKEAVEAYKEALRINPDDDETRLNLSHALRNMKAQEQQEQKKQEENNDDNQQNQDQEQNSDKEEKGDKDQENENKGGQDKQENKENKENKPGDKEGKQQPSQPEQSGKEKPMNMSPREAQQLLDAAEKEDQRLQLQIRQQKGEPKKIDKDW